MKLDDSIKILDRFKNKFLRNDETLREAGFGPKEGKISIYLTKEDEENFTRKILKKEKRDNKEHESRDKHQIIEGID